MAASTMPTDLQLKELLPVIRRCVNSVRSRYKSIFDCMGLESQDLVNLSLVHGVHFLHRYQPTGNEGLFYRYLSQRLSEVARVTGSKIRNCVPADQDLGTYAALDEQLPAADSVYEDGRFQLHRGTVVHDLEIRGSESMTPNLYLDGIIIENDLVRQLRDELWSGSATIVPVEDLEPSPTVAQSEALAYLALSPDHDRTLRQAAVRLCKNRFGIKYLSMRTSFEALRTRVLDQKLLPSRFMASNGPRVPRGIRSDFASLKDELRSQLLATSKAHRRCLRCSRRKSVSDFSIKIVRDPGAEPRKALFCSYCKHCKREINGLAEQNK